METGRAFVDFNGVELSDWTGHKITIRDSAGKELVGCIKAAGTGETYSSELLNNPTFETTANIWVDDATAASVLGGQTDRCLRVTSNGIGSHFSAGDSKTCANGALLKGSAYVKAGTEGRQSVSLGIAGGDWHTWNILFNTDGPLDWTACSAYGTADSTNFAMIYGGYVDPAAAGEIRYFDTASVKQVLTPSATGVTITNSAASEVYDWASEESGFNRNDYFGYTYEIELVSASISPSASPSISPSISPSLSPSISTSVSPSASLSPSISTSVSPSASLSPSLSPSIGYLHTAIFKTELITHTVNLDSITPVARMVSIPVVARLSFISVTIHSISDTEE
jgi:hypothetical protein